MLIEIGFILLKIIVVIICVMLSVAYLTYMERKVLGHIQLRYGPMMTGWHGLLQPIADGLKLVCKELIVPTNADKIVYLLSPVMCFIPALVVFAVVPFTPQFYITDINIGVLYFFAVGGLSVYGVVFAGWASNSKYSLMGGLRSAAQMISYEVSMGLAIVSVVIVNGTMSMKEIVSNQAGLWNIVLLPLGFLVFLVAGVAELNRCPFDMPECESELVAGFHTEYSSMGFALFFLSEYAEMIAIAALAVTLFFGGWRGPFLPGVFWFVIKVFLFQFFFIWIRGTLPRVRYDQLMALGWKVLLPLALINLFWASVLKMFIMT